MPDSPNSSDPANPLLQHFPYAEGLSKLAVAAALTLYVLGLLIVNEFDQKFGVTGFSPLRVRYILVGFTWALQVAFVGTLWAWISKLTGAKPLWLRALIRATLILCPSIIGGLLSFLFVEHASKFRTFSGGFVHGAVCLLSVGSAAFFLVKLFRKISTLSIFTLREVTAREALIAVWQVWFLVSAISLYSAYIYPYMPPYYGGGAMLMIRLHFKPGKYESMQPLGLSVTHIPPVPSMFPGEPPLPGGATLEGMTPLLRLVEIESDAYIVSDDDPLSHSFWDEVDAQIWRIPKDDVDGALVVGL